MSDNPNEAKQPKMENENPICADGWLAVFDLISPRQLGREIALLSHRFDYYVDEHFRTRKWKLGYMEIKCKIGENGAEEMQIVNYKDESLPIPQVPMPKKVVGFKHILIKYIDQNVVDFLHHFRRIFSSSGTYLNIMSVEDGDLEIIHNIWPLIKDNICVMALTAGIGLCQMRQFVPFILSDCPSLRTLYLLYNVFPSFPSDNSANATYGQLVAKWLFLPSLLPDGAPKGLKCIFSLMEQWSLKIDAFKKAFAGASSRANFIIMITFLSYYIDSVVPFELINNSTGERLTLKWHYNSQFLLVRCPIVRDEQKWIKWEEEVFCWRFSFSQIVVHLPIH